LFEKKIVEAASKSSDQFLIVRGLPDGEKNDFHLPNCKVYNHMNTAEMQAAIESSEFIISRCGYTTVMEILALKKRSVFIPTPGQTEQEYLARYLKGKKIFYTVDQKKFSLHQSLADAGSFPFAIPDHNMQQYRSVISEFVKSL